MKRTAIKRKRSGTRLVKSAFNLAFPKPKDVYRETPAVIYYPDGREVCNETNARGKKEYKCRTLQMAERQDGVCCLYGVCPFCPRVLTEEDVSFEHENGRGGGKRDDRIELPDGKRINGAAHVACNQWKGSRRIPYNGAQNSVITPDKGAMC